MKKLAHIFRCMLTCISPKLNTHVCFLVKFKKKLDLDNPQTLDEKILWLKLNTYWNNPLVKLCADKFSVRYYVKGCGLEKILTPLIGVYSCVKDIPWKILPNKFAIKYNIGCGKNIIVNNKKQLDITNTGETIGKWFKSKQWLPYSEMQYKDVHPYILIEKSLIDEKGNLPVDYKFYCFNGKAKYVMVCLDREKDKIPAFYYLDKSWNKMPFSNDYFKFPNREIPKPSCIDEAFEIAEKLSEPFPFVRTDLYIVNDKIYFGELTFTPGGGMDVGRLRQTDEILGKELNLQTYYTCKS